MTAFLAATALTAGGLFAGAALYISAVEHPARCACGPPMAVAEFRMSYPRAAALQAPLAVVGATAATLVWFRGATLDWLVAALLLGSVVPFTLTVIRPTTRRLLDRSLAPDAPEARMLLRRWGGLHLVRTLLGGAAFLLMLRLTFG